MTQHVQYTVAGEGIEFVAPDAVLTVKIDAGHTDDHYELFEVDAATRADYSAASDRLGEGLLRTDWPHDRPGRG